VREVAARITEGKCMYGDGRVQGRGRRTQRRTNGHGRQLQKRGDGRRNSAGVLGGGGPRFGQKNPRWQLSVVAMEDVASQSCSGSR